MTLRPSVRELLRSFTPTDDVEADHLRRMSELIEVAANPFVRSHFEPGHFTASAFVLDPEATHVLLIEHAKLHRWLQPGGHFEPEDADLFAAARREVAEETGLVEVDDVLGRTLLDVDVHDIPPLKGEPAHAHFDLRVLFRARTHQVTAATDAQDAKWVPLGAVSVDASDASVMRAIHKIQAAGIA